MPQHKFKIGQSVQYRPDNNRAAPPSGTFKIVRLLPSIGRDQQYRIKNSTEPYERVAQEEQLINA